MYRYMTILAAAMFSLAAAAQNLDPTVVVSRAYEGNLVEVHKPALEMSVPDSVRAVWISPLSSPTSSTTPSSKKASPP